MEAKEELKGLIKSLMDEDKAAQKAAEKDEAYAKLLEENKELKAAEEARKNSPGKEVKLLDAQGKAVDFVYKGYDLRNQCADIGIASEDTKDLIAKFTIDMITKASLNEGNTGAYAVPDEYESTLFALARLQSIALNECRIFNISRDVLKIPTEASGMSLDAQASGTANVESDPTLGQVVLNMKRVGNYTEIYNDLLEDSVFDISSWIAAMNAEALGQTIDDNVFGSTGTVFSGNALADAGTSVTVGTSTSHISDVSYTHFSEAVASLSAKSITGSKFYLNRLGMHYIRTEKDSNNRPIYTLPTADNSGLIYGFPVKSVETITGAPATTAPFVLFGNLKNYALGIRKGLTMQVNPYVKMKEDITQFIMHARMDGDCLADNAFVNIAIG